MPQPFYTIRLLNQEDILLDQDQFDESIEFGGDANSVLFLDQSVGDAFISFGNAAGTEAIGQTFPIPGGANFYAFEVQIRKIGAPIDDIEMGIATFLSQTEIQMCRTKIPAHSIAASPGASTILFIVPSKALFFPTAVTGFYLQRTGAVSASNYYKIRYSPTSQISGGIWYRNGSTGVWSSSSGSDLRFKAYSINTVNQWLDAGQDFEVSENSEFLKSISVYLSQTGTPTDTVFCEVYEGLNFDIDNIFARSVPLVDGQRGEVSGTGKKTFYFGRGLRDIKYPYPELDPSKNYTFLLHRRGLTDGANYWKMDNESSSVYADGTVRRFDREDWDIATPIGQVVSGKDARFEIIAIGTIPSENLADDIIEVTINTGKNEFDGQIREGVCDIILNNKSGKFSVENQSSELFGKFDINIRMEILVNYDSVDYPLFLGPIADIIPSLLFNDRTTHVKLTDEFFSLSKDKISIGNQITKTASELINLILDAVRIRAINRDVEIDFEQLKTVTWDNILPLDKLKTIVEAGQHHHFIDGEGKYVFKNNQWLSSNIPEFIFEENVNLSPDDGRIKYQLSTIRNNIHVLWNSSSEDRDNPDSILKYGLFEFTLDNELMPNADYAGFIADYLLLFFKDQGNTLKLIMNVIYPDIFQISFGTAIQFISAFAGINNIYNIIGLTRRFDNLGNHQLEMDCRKWIFPPQTGDFSILEPFIGDAWIGFGKTTQEVSQGFKLAVDGELHKLFLELRTNFTAGTVIKAKLFTVDGSGLPTGAVIESSNNVNIPAGVDVEDNYEFTFPAPRTELFAANTYSFTVEAPIQRGSIFDNIIFVGNKFYDLKSLDYDLVAQSFIITGSGTKDLSRVGFTFHWTGGGLSGFTASVELYAADGSGFPTGAKLAEVELLLTGDKTDGAFTNFIFEVPTIITLGVSYVLVLDVPKDQMSSFEISAKDSNQYIGGTASKNTGAWAVFENTADFEFRVDVNNFENPLEIRGKNSNAYANGVPGIKDLDDVWSLLGTKDFQFRIESLNT